MATQPPKEVDTIINARWILPVSPNMEVLENHSIAIQNGKILSLQPQNTLNENYFSKQQFHFPHHLVMPGLINGHGHAAMTLLRGYADDLPLMSWLQEHIWPAESKWVTPEFVHDGTELAIAEMLLAGTTFFSDMYFFPETVAQLCRASGIKAQITCPILDFPTAWANTADEYIDKTLELRSQFTDCDHVRIGFGPHAPYTVSNAPFERLADLSQNANIPIQIHAHETTDEINQSLNTHGVRPLDRLESLGVLGARTQCVHMTQLTESDIDKIAKTQSSVIHCPESNMKLASGLSPVHQLLQKGIKVGLGTDGAASNNDLNLFGELSTAALLGKITSNNATAISAEQAIKMATLGGAEALGIDHETGSLTPGKAADMIALDMSHLSLQPMYNIASHLAYNNRAVRVSHLWINGRNLVADGMLTTIDPARIIEKTQQWQLKIKAN